MKKIFFFIAALVLSIAAQATVVNCKPGTNNLSWYLTQGDTLVLADGEYTEDYSITFDKPGVCVKAAEGAKPVIKLTGEWTDFSITATTTFDGITFDGGGVANYFLATTGAESGTLTVVNCVFRNWAYWAISNQFETAASVDAVIVDNCLFHDGKGAAIRFSDKAPAGKHACNYLKVTNSTFYNIVETNYAAVIQANSNGEATGEQNEVIIDRITLYNFDASQLGAISMRKTSKLSITNSIIATPENKDQYAFYIYGGNVNNTLYFNGKAKSGPAYNNCLTVDPMFVDAANGDFTLREGSPALTAGTDGKAIGDPRWAPVVEEPVEPEHTYTVAGSSEAAFGTAWDPANADNDMKKQEDGTYKWEKEGLELLAGEVAFKVTEDHAWTVAYPAQDYKLAIAETGIYTLTITFNPADKVVAATATKTGDVVIIPTIAMHGNFLGEWKDTENFTLAADEATATLTLTIAEGNYEFGMRIGGSGNWTSNGVAFTRENASAEIVAGSGNLTLAADVAGEYTFTWTYATNTLTVTYPVVSEPEYEIYEEEITNLVIDYDNMLIKGGPSANFLVEVTLGLGEYNRNDDTFQLLPESSISVQGSDATFVEGYATVDGIAQTVEAVVRCLWNDMAIEFHLSMSAAPLEATVVVVENAVVEIEKYLLFGDMYDYALKMTGVWTNEGVDYPVLVEVPVYYPEATEPSIIFSTVTVGGMGDDDPWLGFGEGDLTITTVDNTITATGIVENPMAGIAIDITISGTITPSGVENATVTINPVKMIQNGQLIIIKNDVQYNAQGAVLK